MPRRLSKEEKWREVINKFYTSKCDIFGQPIKAAKGGDKHLWCEPEEVGLAHLYLGYAAKKEKKFPRIRIRCKKCKRRFLVRFHRCHDENCIHAYLPPHKK